jgi:hypothetical protein
MPPTTRKDIVFLCFGGDAVLPFSGRIIRSREIAQTKKRLPNLSGRRSNVIWSGAITG